VSVGKNSAAPSGWAAYFGDYQRNVHAVDANSGKEIWKAELPTSGGATPMTYQTRPNGKQYLVIAAGGHAKVTEEKQSDEIVAYTLP